MPTARVNQPPFTPPMSRDEDEQPAYPYVVPIVITLLTAVLFTIGVLDNKISLHMATGVGLVALTASFVAGCILMHHSQNCRLLKIIALIALFGFTLFSSFYWGNLSENFKHFASAHDWVNWTSFGLASTCVTIAIALTTRTFCKRNFNPLE